MKPSVVRHVRVSVTIALSMAVAGAVLVPVPARTEPQAPAPAVRTGAPPEPDGQLHVLPVQGNVHMVVAGSVNVTFQIGDEGVLLVDSGPGGAMTDQIVAAIRKMTSKPIRYILNTHAHMDHVGGNAAIAKLGMTIAGGNVGAGANTGASILSHEEVLNRVSAPTGQTSAIPSAGFPTDTYYTARKDLYFNGEPIEIRHMPNAHTDGDSIVFFRRSDVISTGDVLLTTTYPVIDLKWGGNIQGVLRALNELLDIAVPKDKQEGGTYLIPGHGRLTDEADLLEYRDMLTIIRDRIDNMVSKKMTLAQVKAARPTLDYDARYGPKTGPWTADMFVEAVYQNLSAERAGTRPAAQGGTR